MAATSFVEGRASRKINPHFDSNRHAWPEWRSDPTESDHEALKRLLRYRQSIRSLRSAEAILEGNETMRTTQRSPIYHIGSGAAQTFNSSRGSLKTLDAASLKPANPAPKTSAMAPSNGIANLRVRFKVLWPFLTLEVVAKTAFSWHLRFAVFGRPSKKRFNDFGFKAMPAVESTINP